MESGGGIAPRLAVHGEPWKKLFQTEVLDEWDALIRPALEGREVTSFPQRVFHRTGRRLFCECRISPLKTDDEVVGCSILLQRMATPDEGMIAAGPDFLLGLIEAMPFMIYLFDLQERSYLFVNEHATSILGYTPEEVIRMGPNFFDTELHPDDREFLPRYFNEIQYAEDGDIVENDFSCHS